MTIARQPRPLQGVLPVFHTPFNEDESIDAASLQREIEFAYDQGADGVVMAMVSETLRLSTPERQQLAELAIKFGSPRGVVIISVGAESTHTAKEYARHAEGAGADAVMAIPPVATALGEAELGRYYRQIIETIQIPVIVQDASGYVGRPISIELQAQLLHEYGPQRVQYKPEANPIGPKLSELRDGTQGKARVFEGTGGIMLVDSYRRGIVGTMPAVDCIDALVGLWRALQAGDEEKTARISDPLTSLICMMTSLDGFLAIGKYLLKKRGVFKNTVVRGPVSYTIDQESRKEVDRRFDRLMAALR